LARIESPTSVHVSALLRLPSASIVQRRFFSSLTSKQWLGPLVLAGIYATAPEEIVDKDAGMVRYPAWPAGDYLLRRAADRNSEREIVEIARRLKTNNAVVHMQLADIIVLLPPA